MFLFFFLFLLIWHCLAYFYCGFMKLFVLPLCAKSSNIGYCSHVQLIIDGDDDNVTLCHDLCQYSLL